MTGQTGLAAALQLVIQKQGQELNRGELALGGLRRPNIQGEHHGREPELAQLGEERMTDHLSLPSTETKKSAPDRAKANERCASRGAASGNGSWSRAELRICLIRR